MIQLKSPWLAILLLAACMFSCKDDDDPDPRSAYEGTYEIDDWTFSITNGTDERSGEPTLDLPIELMINADMANDELDFVNKQEFFDQLMQFVIFVLYLEEYEIHVFFDEEMVVEVDGDSFEIDATKIRVVVEEPGSPLVKVFDSEIEMEGTINGSSIEFEMSGEVLDYDFEIEASGEK
ncbi:hypothetical protein [Fulvivirga ligni]|uniref:hypothetical protein n=1 Tax=Fulvivirga ligni TaxID=2904246 RepID=UPI001F2F158E|nr:hypothetical protein [Fulvivirga ligni]UII19858.1 hypothetical protein LVD16_18610 [Fulvivirga ligni]